MAKNKTPANKTGIILIAVFICLIILATICVLLLTPFAKRFFGIGKNGEPIGTSQTEFISQEVNTTKEHHITLISPDEMPSVSIPDPTKADDDSDKNYAFFIDKKRYDYTEANGVTTLTAKDNKNVIISVTPYSSTSYSKLCSDTAKTHEKNSEQPKLNIENLYSAYHSDLNGTTTTIYCIDDGNGGSIKLKYERPSRATEFDKDFEILVSMFKVK